MPISVGTSGKAMSAVKDELTAESLPKAIGALFELNNYQVEYSKKINGAEVDIVAVQKGSPFAPTVYIEATVQYVDNTKYGKDLTKFAMVKLADPACVCISVSTKGFTPDVKERAAATAIRTDTYRELFMQFERFAPYADLVLENKAINSLVEAYEEPYFRDHGGEQIATSWLDEWKRSETMPSWLVILGEYGTGKTALTQRVLNSWINDYKADPSQPIPFRIELRNFTRQFDARSLIHHFLDSNGLGHIPIEFVFHLIRNRRVLLVLDGYDEMAQFLNARERRSCLAALAELSSAGAKGILTSRPNYFTEAEELNVFEALYTSLEQNKYHIGQIDRLFIASEKQVDALLENYLVNRNERYLRDLSPDQTKALVRRKLHEDEDGQAIVIDLLEKVFREETSGKRQALSGKPVIISYLLELVDELRSGGADQAPADLTEWQIYKLIVDRLMLRDLQRSPTPPELRRQALQRLSLTLSRKEVGAATEEIFLDVINDLFKADLRRLTPEERRARQDELFQDLRSSATLTREEIRGKSGWVFSHNSLREYLVAELCVGSLVKGAPIDVTFPVTSAMRSFVGSLGKDGAASFLAALQSQWGKRQNSSFGAMVSLGYDLMAKQDGGLARTLLRVVGNSQAGSLDFDKATIKEIDLSSVALDRRRIVVSAEEATLTEASFKGVDLAGSRFDRATLDRVTFIGTRLTSVTFNNALIFECDLSDCDVNGADFTSLDPASNFMVTNSSGEIAAIAGASAIGWLRFNGATTDEVSAYHELQHHSKFSIVLKICENIADQRNSQLRGLTQRGAAQGDPVFARKFVGELKSAGLIDIVRSELVTPTSDGRKALTRFVSHHEMPTVVEEVLRKTPST